MATIVFDCRFASFAAGIGTYVRGIIPELLPLLHEHRCVLIVHSTSEEWLSSVPTDTEIVEVTAKHYSLSEQFRISTLLKKLKADLFFCPHFNVPFFCPVPFVATIHDLILHRFPNNASLPKQCVYRLLMNRTVRKAKKLVAVSAFTKTELAALYGTGISSKTSTVPEGYSSEFSKLSIEQCEPVLDQYGLKPGYLLYVGNAKQHKNVQMLLDAHANVPDAPQLVLVCSGKEAKSLSFHDNAIRLEGVPHKALPALYSSARCFVTPSLYEGFCLPIIEANACGCPVMASNATAIPEVTGTHAVIFEPTNDGIREALMHIPTQSDAPRADCTWENAASMTCAILTDTIYG